MHIYRVKNPACFLWKFSDFPVVKVVLLLHEGGQYEEGIIIKCGDHVQYRMMVEITLCILKEIFFLFIKLAALYCAINFIILKTYIAILLFLCPCERMG